MIAHFQFPGSDNSLYFSIASIRQHPGGLQLCGTVGDGSAETCFEALVAVQVRVQVLEIWDADGDSLCRRYGRELLEEELAFTFAELRFRSEGVYDRASGCWQQRIVAEPAAVSGGPSYPVTPRVRPHQQACESPADWSRLAV